MCEWLDDSIFYLIIFFCWLARKPFGKYKMLLDLLISNQDEFNTRSNLNIDDYLIDPKTSSSLKVRN